MLQVFAAYLQHGGDLREGISAATSAATSAAYSAAWQRRPDVSLTGIVYRAHITTLTRAGIWDL
jgi:hypothetical protein